MPLMYNCKTKRGPLGRGTDQSGESCHFDSNEWLEQRKLDLRGFRVSAKEYVNAVQIIGTDKSVSNDEIGKHLYGLRRKFTSSFILDRRI